MTQFTIHQLDAASKQELIRVVRELREQYIASGCSATFYFLPSRVSDDKFSEPTLSKWLAILSNNDFIRYSKSFFDNVIFDSNAPSVALGLSQKYTIQTIPSSTPYPQSLDQESGFIVTILNRSFDQIIDTIQANNSWGKFFLDKVGRVHYDGALLPNSINGSYSHKNILIDLLMARDHTITADETDKYFPNDDNNVNRNNHISLLGRTLKSIDRSLGIETTLEGNRSKYYTLTM